MATTPTLPPQTQRRCTLALLLLLSIVCVAHGQHRHRTHNYYERRRLRREAVRQRNERMRQRRERVRHREDGERLGERLRDFREQRRHSRERRRNKLEELRRRREAGELPRTAPIVDTGYKFAKMTIKLTTGTQVMRTRLYCPKLERYARFDDLNNCAGGIYCFGEQRRRCFPHRTSIRLDMQAKANDES